MPIDKGAITGHFLAHCGVPTNIRPRQVNPFGDFARLEFAPKGTRALWRYATNGMSGRTQLTDERGTVRTELYTCSQDRIPWVDELLTVIATYSFLNETYLSEFDTIDAQQPIDQGTSPYRGA
jgi:Suppressor of fused protein (SUFU)